MRRHYYFLVCGLLLLLVFGCTADKSSTSIDKEYQSVSKGPDEAVFTYTTVQLSAMLSIPSGWVPAKQKSTEVRNNEFSVNLYEVSLSTGIIGKDLESNTMGYSVKLIDIGESTLYPSLASHNFFYKFGVEKNTEIEYKKKAVHNGWELVFSYDKVEKKGSFTAYKRPLFIIMNSDLIQLDQAESLLIYLLDEIKN